MALEHAIMSFLSGAIIELVSNFGVFAYLCSPRSHLGFIPSVHENASW